MQELKATANRLELPAIATATGLGLLTAIIVGGTMFLLLLGCLIVCYGLLKLSTLLKERPVTEPTVWVSAATVAAGNDITVRCELRPRPGTEIRQVAIGLEGITAHQSRRKVGDIDLAKHKRSEIVVPQDDAPGSSAAEVSLNVPFDALPTVQGANYRWYVTLRVSTNQWLSALNRRYEIDVRPHA